MENEKAGAGKRFGFCGRRGGGGGWGNTLVLYTIHFYFLASV